MQQSRSSSSPQAVRQTSPPTTRASASPTTTRSQQVDGGPGTCTGGCLTEPNLDIEQVQTQAPGANVISYEGPDTQAGYYDVLSKIVSDDTAKVISLSWSLSQCETDFTVIPSVNTLLAKAASQGQTVLAASGDSGSEGCAKEWTSTNTGAVSTLATTYPASDPNVTAVGGTALGSPDAVWNDCTSGASSCAYTINGSSIAFTNTGAGGGGISTLFSEPSWQVGRDDNQRFMSKHFVVPRCP